MERSVTGYKRKRQEKDVYQVTNDDSSDEINISISSLAQSGHTTNPSKTDITTVSTSLNKEGRDNKTSESKKVKVDDAVHLEIRKKLQKSSGYKPDLSCFNYRKLPKPPEEEFFTPEMHKSEEEKKRILEQAPIIFENRVGPNVNPEQARKAQKATFNKMLARSCGRSRKTQY